LLLNNIWWRHQDIEFTFMWLKLDLFWFKLFLVTLYLAKSNILRIRVLVIINEIRLIQLFWFFLKAVLYAFMFLILFCNGYHWKIFILTPHHSIQSFLILFYYLIRTFLNNIIIDDWAISNFYDCVILSLLFINDLTIFILSTDTKWFSFFLFNQFISFSLLQSSCNS
jgi:hypothetical protein